MASSNWTAEQLAPSSAFASTPGIPAPIPAEQLFGVPPTITNYVMRGEDKNVNGLFDEWKVSSNPDFSASSYHGSLATPLRDVVVQSKG